MQSTGVGVGVNGDSLDACAEAKEARVAVAGALHLTAACNELPQGGAAASPRTQALGRANDSSGDLAAVRDENLQGWGPPWQCAGSHTAGGVSRDCRRRARLTLSNRGSADVDMPRSMVSRDTTPAPLRAAPATDMTRCIMLARRCGNRTQACARGSAQLQRHLGARVAGERT